MPQRLLNAACDANQGRQQLLLIQNDPIKGGMNSRLRPQYIGDHEASELINVDLADPTSPKTRFGYTQIPAGVTGISAGLQGRRPSGLAYLNPGTGSKALVMPIPRGGLGATYWNTDPSLAAAWAEVKIGGVTAFDPNNSRTLMIQMADCLYIVPDSTQNIAVLDAVTGQLTDSLNNNDNAGAGGSPPRGAVDGFYLFNRPWLFVDGSPPALHYGKFLPTAASAPTDWARLGLLATGGGVGFDAGRVQLSPNKGSRAIAARPWQEKFIVCFFDSCIELVDLSFFSVIDVGGVGTTVSAISNPFNYASRRVLETRYGCSSARSVVSYGQELIFLDNYARLRRLGQTVNAAQSGIAALPLSERVHDLFGPAGRINKQALAATQCYVADERLFVEFALDGSTEANACAVYDLSHELWEGYFTWANATSAVAVSNMRDSGQHGDEVFAANGDASSSAPLVFRRDPTVFNDNGQKIEMAVRTKAYDLGHLEGDKTIEGLELAAIGSPNVRIRLSVMLNEDGIWRQHTDVLTIPSSAASSWPLVFPLVFPLIDQTYAITRHLFQFPNSAIPDSGRARLIRFEFRASVSSTDWIQIADWLAFVRPWHSEKR